MTLSAHVLLHDILDVVMSDDRCSCVSLAHVTDAPDYAEAMEDILGMLYTVAQTAPNEEALRHAVGHILNVVTALGYAIGAADAYDVTLSADIVIPDDLASVDFLGDGSEDD